MKEFYKSNDDNFYLLEVFITFVLKFTVYNHSGDRYFISYNASSFAFL